MFDAKRLLDQFLGGNPADGAGQPGAGAGVGGIVGRAQTFARDNPLLAGGLAGGLAGVVLGRGGLGTLVKVGGMAAIGGLAYNAYRNWQHSQGAAGAPPVPGDSVLLPPPADSPFAPANAPSGESKLAETLIVAMIAAAKADGRIAAEERGRIYERLEEGGLDAEEVAFLNREFQEPVSLERIAAGVHSKEEALEVYAASLIAIRADTPAEQEYLAALAARLGIEPGLAEAVEKTVSEAGKAATV